MLISFTFYKKVKYFNFGVNKHPLFSILLTKLSNNLAKIIINNENESNKIRFFQNLANFGF